MKPKVSIVLSCYNRGRQLAETLKSIYAQDYSPLEVIVVEDGYDGGLTENAAKNYGAHYYRRWNRADIPAFQNPSRIHNIGIRRTTGEIIVLQGGEVRYDTRSGIHDLVAPVAADPQVSTFALVRSLDPQGKFLEWYSHPTEGSRAGWKINFCQAVNRSIVVSIGGFDESFWGYGGEDNDFESRLEMVGVRLQYAENVIASHQWHARPGYGSVEFVGGQRSGAVANVGKEWGQL